MPSTDIPAQPLRLAPVQGPDIPTPVIAETRYATVGRAADCQACLVHETVSRRHATVSCRSGRWFIADLGSRHGTYVNAVKLEPNSPAALENGDLVRVGPWTFRVVIGPERAHAGVTMYEAGPTTQRVERVPERELEWATRQRLNLLIECSAAINAADSEERLVLAALEAAIAGSGYRRAAWIRLAGADDQIEVVGFRTLSQRDEGAFAFSRSLIREAAQGQLARLTEGTAGEHGQSIVSLGIHSALCAPIVVGSATVGFLYFDSRGQESKAHPETAGFCQAIARMCGLSLSHLKRAELERRQQRIEADLSAAREAQQLIMPPALGEISGLRYASRTKPGRTVAGDLFDVVPLDGGRVGVCIGDVTGESIGAGILMATTQAYLNGALTRCQDAAAAMRELNNYLCSRSPTNRFVTMWVGVIDPASGVIRYVDAGHGHWLIKRPGRLPVQPLPTGGIPVAIEPGYNYQCQEMTLGPGDRVLLYSDGLPEQRSPSGEEFGKARVLATLGEGAGVEGDVNALFEAVLRFAGTDMLDDDATAASIQTINP